MKKQELIEILVNEYGYEAEDLKFDADKKPYTNAKLQALIDAEVEDANTFAQSKPVLKRKVYKDDDGIEVMCASLGKVVYHSPISRRKFKFTEFGQTQKIPYQEIINMIQFHPAYFTEGTLIIMDKTIQEDYGLTDMYQKVLTPKNIESVFEMNIDELEVLVKTMPESARKTFVSKAQELFEDDKLDSYKIIQLIEREFGFDLKTNTPISDVAVKGEGGIIYVDKR